MKREDFNRLKEICEKERFYIEAFNGLFAIKEKDIWRGVEFVEYLNENSMFFTKSKIYKIFGEKNISLIDDISNKPNHNWMFQGLKEKFNPSTESAYIEQLKKNAFEKFGEIKEGDRFINPNGIKVNAQSGKFEYHKEIDSLFCGLALIYQQGKWAEKLPERVKVEFTDYDYGIGSHYSDYFSIYFKTKNIGERDYNQIGQFLAQQLEEYLNKQL